MSSVLGATPEVRDNGSCAIIAAAYRLRTMRVGVVRRYTLFVYRAIRSVGAVRVLPLERSRALEYD